MVPGLLLYHIYSMHNYNIKLCLKAIPFDSVAIEFKLHAYYKAYFVIIHLTNTLVMNTPPHSRLDYILCYLGW